MATNPTMGSRKPLYEVFYSPTPNGWKVVILLEELVEAKIISSDDYHIVPVNLLHGEQFKEDFLKISPNGRIPALRHGDITIFESGAILSYIAETEGRFFGKNLRDKYDVLQWVFWQVGGLGPMAGQVSHFVNYAPQISSDVDHSYSIERYRREYYRLLTVMDKVLAKHPYLAECGYSIADMACVGWLVPHKRFGVSLDKTLHVKKWFTEMRKRPAVSRGISIWKESSGIVDLAKYKDTTSILFKRSKM